ncbi:GNAT family N-acetyltransferase [Asaia astilbis]
MPSMTEWSLTLHASITEIGAAAWDRCAGDDNPFLFHAFFLALEESGSVGARTGWLPRYAALHDGTGLVAVAPLFLKGHSYGEYVFDQSWARAYEQAGGQYYPKLQIAVPFSPVSGQRLLIDPAHRASGAIRGVFADALRQACQELGLSSVHMSFCTQDEQETLSGHGWMGRIGLQYHWHNQNYASFDQFLEALASRKRKAIKRERRDAQSCGLDFRTLRGPEITEEDWDRFYTFYQATIDRKWGHAYLTRAFFTGLSERLGDRVVLMQALDRGVPVAAALNLAGRDTLYGRNWGCEGEWPFLHFELCYYRAIDFAIAEGLSRVEAGAQGEHKIQRGYLPSLTYSSHFIRDPALAQAVRPFLEEERAAIMQEKEALASFSPYRTENIS